MRLRITSKGVFCISEETTSKKNIEKSSDHAKVMVKHECVPAAANSSKRKAQTSNDHGQTCKKRPKMDPNVKLQHCTASRVLKELTSHRIGQIFNKQAADMKSTPDYNSSKVTNPMNLGSIRRKPQGNMYFNVEGFSGAATYNPPAGHPVHKVAKHLEGTPSKSGKKVESTQLKNGNITVKRASFMDDMRQGCHYVKKKKTVGKNCPKTKPFGLNKARVCGQSGTSRLQVSSKEHNHQKTKQLVGHDKGVQLGTENRCPNARAFANHRQQSHDISDSSEAKCGSLICHCHLKKGSPQTSLNVQMSPKKAMRAAMLKARFADNIFKATEKITIKSDTAARMHHERERLENDPKMLQREREREAARMALQKMERTVYIDENLVILKDREEMLYGKALGHGRALEQFGLYVKDDNYSEKNEDRILNAEEGEIIEF